MTQLNATHDPARRSWVESANQAECDFPIQNLPFGIFNEGGVRRAGVALGDKVIDLQALLSHGLLDGHAAIAAHATASGRLNELMEMEKPFASALRAQLSDLFRSDGPSAMLSGARAHAETILLDMKSVSMEVPCSIGDYTDFLTSLHHTERHGRFKGLKDPLPPAFKSLPVAYHSRASSIRISGTEVVRPNGQYKDADGEVRFGPAPMMDFELELAAFIGRGNELTQPIPIDRAREHIFGYCLLNDWSAKSIQWWEQVLGPFLGKSFITSISPWIVTEEALLPFRLPAPARPAGDPPPLDHLNGKRDQSEGGIDIALEAWISTATQRSAGQDAVCITRTHLQNLYWTFGQMITHHASNGCNLRPGDLIGSGTISGESDISRACITELTNAGKDPLLVGNGEFRTALEDGDEMIFRARAAREGAVAIGFGECRGRVQPARTWPA
ncbi:fumarylacetoacetase [Noviherbaspirillum malthae]|uniref:fumarylacetoacetase n=1 Tax=Noviherbaspirillum malthae TaxID=1260987 RepID=UPI00188ED001|nr:fumarylacetoacetase [Noviherbaspirillum malthae]